MGEGCDMGTDGSTAQGGIASHPLLPGHPTQGMPGETMGLGAPHGTGSGLGAAPLHAGAQPCSAPTFPTGSPSLAAAFPLPG